MRELTEMGSAYGLMPVSVVVVVARPRVGAKWRTDHPEATLRFYALMLRDVGMIKMTPQKLLAQGTDWRFLNEPKKELKG